MKRRIISTLLILIYLFSFVSCKKEKEPITVYYSFENAVTSFDPSLADDVDDFLVCENLFEGLLRFNEKNILYSEICDDYYISEDELTYTFVLKNNLKWSDGTPLTSDDFRFSVERALSKETEAPNANYLFSILNAKKFYEGKVRADMLGIEITDDRTISFVLAEKDPNFITAIASPVLMPCNRTFFEKTKGKYGLDGENIITNGPFKVETFTKDYLFLSKNQEYISKNSITLDNICIYQKVSSTDAETQFLEGKLDILSFDANNYKEFNPDKYNLYSYSNITYGVVFNMSNEIGKNADFRKMISACINIDELSKNFPVKFKKAEGLIPPSCIAENKNYRETVSTVEFEYNKEKATEAYKKFISKSKEHPPKLTMIYPDINGLKEIITDLVYVYQTEFSLFINPKPLPIDEFNLTINSGEYQLAFSYFVSDDISPIEILKTFKGDSENSYKFKDEKFDRLFRSIPRYSSSGASSKIRACENYLINKKEAVLPIAYGCTYYAVSKNISNITIRPSGGKLDFRFIKVKD